MCRYGNLYPRCQDLCRPYSKDVRDLSIGFENEESAPLCLNREKDRLTLPFSFPSSILQFWWLRAFADLTSLSLALGSANALRFDHFLRFLSFLHSEPRRGE